MPNQHENILRRYAEERQLANTYMSLARTHLKNAKEAEDRLSRIIQRKPLSKNDRVRLTALIETGEIEYVPEPENDEPF